MAISAFHKAEVLTRRAVDPRVAGAAGVASVRKPSSGLLYPYVGIDGSTSTQFRPDDPGDGPKYVFEKDAVAPINVHPAMKPRVLDPSVELVIVEGTNQYLAAVSNDPTRAVVGMAGCYGWSSGGMPTPSLRALPIAGRKITVVFDADRTANLNVYEAGAQLAEWLVSWGAGEIRWVDLPGRRAKAGLDDVLASVEAKERRAMLDRILGSSSPKIGTKPRRGRDTKGEGALFHPEFGLLLAELVDVVVARYPIALTPADGRLHVYRDGVYRPAHGRELGPEFLPQRYRRSYGDALHDALLARARAEDRLMPVVQSDRIVNVSNGLLDLDELELHPHSPDYLSTTQIPVRWDPGAVCPIYDEWIVGRVDGQVDDLEESVSVMLDPTRAPTKAVLCYGETRSGKSTFLRLAQMIAGIENVSSIPLHDLTGNSARRAAANLFGKILNTSADLSAKDLHDLSTFKMATGEDRIYADRKYGAELEFENRTLLMFSMNTIPATSEASGAYLERVKPFAFPHSYAGAEDRSIEEAMIRDELSGIFRRWIEALGRLRRRGRPLPTDPTIFEEFAQGSDRVRRWVATETTPLEVGTPASKWTKGVILHQTFLAWAKDSGGMPISADAFYKRLVDMGIARAMSGKQVVFDVHLGGPIGVIGVIGVVSQGSLRAREEEEEEGSQGGVLARSTPITPITPITGTVVFDLETDSADRLWTAGPEYARIVGSMNGDLSGPPTVDTNVAAVVDAVNAGATLVAHNGFGFDFHVLDRHYDFDLLELGDAGRLVDTRHVALLADPPEAKIDSRAISAYYELNATAERIGAPGKTDEIGRLAKDHGGFDRIPVDDPEYLAYCAGDVEATAAIVRHYGELDEYGVREMRIQSRLAGSITAVGFAVDLELLEQRLAEQKVRVEQRREWLVETYGLPELKSDGKVAAAPHRTKAGLEALAAAFADLGVDLPTTKAGRPALDKVTMTDVIDACADDPVVVELAEVVRSLNGEPSAYGTIARYVVDGRVHPFLDSRQASGRFSIVRPGLTVLGKRTPALLEQRAVLVADPGELLLAVDLSQIDSRAVAAHAGDEAYAELFGPGRDVHADVAELLWGSREKSFRERAKVCSHGWNYGMGPGRIADLPGVGIDTALEFDAGMRERFPRLVEWQEEVRAIARTGALMDNGFGRWMKPTPTQAYTQGPALMGQGTARDLMMEGVLRLPLEVARMMRAIVHDELVFAVPEDRVEEVRSIALEALKFEWRPPHGRGLAVSIDAGASSPGRSWEECYQ